ncbi:MAG: AMP-binding protein [Rhizobiales bacterium]|nr:AMP-binding protein [Hyphomicrobiales bacterium]
MNSYLALGEVLEQQARSFPHDPLVTFVDDGTTLTYDAFNRSANRVAHGLEALGVRRGDYVGLMMGNSLEFLASSYALKKLGAVEVAINHDFRGPSLSRMVNLTQSPLLIVDAKGLEALGPIQGELPHLRQLIVVGEPPAGGSLAQQAEIIRFDDILAERDDNPGHPVRDDEIAYVLFSSGTTGVSKGILLSHRYAVTNAQGLVEAYDLTREDAVYTPWPLHHFGASIVEFIPALLTGGRAILRSRLSISQFWSDARQHKATWCMMMGASQKYLWDREPSPDDRNHKLRFTWGGPFPVDRAKFEERFGLKTYYCYGLSDCGMLTVRAPYDPQRPTCCGKVRTELFDVRIHDDHDNELELGKTGEIVCRPKVPGVILQAYYGMPDYTLEAFRNLWFHTGDLGKFDENGDLHFFERKKHDIKRSGENILPGEVEEIIHQHPDVEESAVLGKPNENGEQDVVAFVQPLDGRTISEDALRAFCEGRMARWMVPTTFIILDEMPRTTTDKPALGELRKLLTHP